MSAYTDELLTDVGRVKATVRLKSAFPDLEAPFFDVFFDLAQENNFTERRLMDAVNHVVMNCKYPQPKIAEILSFDSHVELLNYAQYTRKNDELHGQVSKYYKSIRVQGFDKPFWAKIEDIQRYNLELFNK